MMSCYAVSTMRFIADLHIHSHYARATSPQMNIVSLTKWSQLKGTNVVGTGDFTHPKWFAELEDKLEPAEEGLFKLKPKYEKEIRKEVPETCRVPMRFLLTVEVSTIYKKNDKVRKVHSLIYSPSFEYVAKINALLLKRGANLHSDGRPIVGMHTKELLQIMLDVSDECLFVPAHIWTPHFAVFGSQSGYDSLQECFEELTPHIYAIETGLSSDPAMNWRIAELDGRTIISNSDAHSPGKLGREANIFNTELSYGAIASALRTNDPKALEATIEFYPEEGKYHVDGHRNCKVRLTPKETQENKFLCPACGRRVTVGVMHRVEDLADKAREEGFRPKGARPFYSIIPLPEIISEVEQVGVQSKRVQGIYMDVLTKLGNEFSILLDLPIADVEAAAGAMLAESIKRMREGDVHIDAGYDGEYGTINILDESDREKLNPQEGLF